MSDLNFYDPALSGAAAGDAPLAFVDAPAPDQSQATQAAASQRPAAMATTVAPQQ